MLMWTMQCRKHNGHEVKAHLSTIRYIFPSSCQFHARRPGDSHRWRIWRESRPARAIDQTTGRSYERLWNLQTLHRRQSPWWEIHLACPFLNHYLPVGQVRMMALFKEAPGSSLQTTILAITMRDLRSLTTSTLCLILSRPVEAQALKNPSSRAKRSQRVKRSPMSQNQLRYKLIYRHYKRKIFLSLPRRKRRRKIRSRNLRDGLCLKDGLRSIVARSTLLGSNGKFSLKIRMDMKCGSLSYAIVGRCG